MKDSSNKILTEENRALVVKNQQLSEQILFFAQFQNNASSVEQTNKIKELTQLINDLKTTMASPLNKPNNILGTQLPPQLMQQIQQNANLAADLYHYPINTVSLFSPRQNLNNPGNTTFVQPPSQTLNSCPSSFFAEKGKIPLQFFIPQVPQKSPYSGIPTANQGFSVIPK